MRYVNGFPAGGATDVLSRILCNRMSEISGQSFVVENKGGAGGMLGGDSVAKEFHNTILNHYFIASNPVEIASVLNGGAGPGWVLTWQHFKVFNTPPPLPATLQ